MSNIFQNPRFLKGLSIVCGTASLVIGAALLFNVFICYKNFRGWQKKG